MFLITKRVWVHSVHVCWFTWLLYIQCFEGDKLEEIHNVLKHSSVTSFIRHQLSFKTLVTLSHQHSKKDKVTFFFVGRSKLTRTNTVAANAFLNEISGYRLGEPDHCSLGGTVDTPVHNTCVEETHMSLTQTHTHAHAKQLSEIRGLQWTWSYFNDLMSCEIRPAVIYSDKICGRSFTFYAWCNWCHVYYVSWLLCQHLEWQNQLGRWRLNRT